MMHGPINIILISLGIEIWGQIRSTFYIQIHHFSKFVVIVY